ncbi:hypothetical protein CHS0354_033703 [Potamilus streckersoni]|uniref:Uncharacterized protein n=1 Tax=Potamilus streckersoni TaxID=2493646 RepID=A0AAE0VMP9_9BIVA|nr:hypothetical protein CHS0354_033703 [Potamilus streckersoni]
MEGTTCRPLEMREERGKLAVRLLRSKAATKVNSILPAIADLSAKTTPSILGKFNVATRTHLLCKIGLTKIKPQIIGRENYLKCDKRKKNRNGEGGKEGDEEGGRNLKTVRVNFGFCLKEASSGYCETGSETGPLWISLVTLDQAPSHCPFGGLQFLCSC